MIAGGVVVVLAAAGLFYAFGGDDSTPEGEVGAYVDRIAAGDADGANALVDPRSARRSGQVDRSALSTALDTAAQRITVTSVSRTGLLSTETGIADVLVRYSLGNRTYTAQLRTRRESTFEPWRVIDPLLVRVQVMANVMPPEGVRLGGVRLPASGPVGDRPPETVLLYPAMYQPGDSGSTWLRALPTPVYVGAPVVAADDDTAGRPLTAPVRYQPTDGLRRLVTTRVTDHLEACAAAGVAMGADCPDAMRLAARPGTRLTVLGEPRLTDAFLAGASYLPAGRGPAILLLDSDPVAFRVTGRSGPVDTESARVAGGVEFDRNDEVRVRFEGTR